MGGKAKTVNAMSAMIAISLVVGGACGSLVRLALGAMPPVDAAWPSMTMGINLSGAAFLGFVTAYMSRLGADIGTWKMTRLGLGTGLIGGYTTYSTFMLEVAKRVNGGHLGVAMSYLLGSIIFGLLCAMLGLKIGEVFGKRRVRINASQPVEFSDSAEPDRRPLMTVAFIIFFCFVLLALLSDWSHWREGGALVLLVVASLLGGLGAFARYGVDAWVNSHIRLPLPCGTIAVNLTASLAMGLVTGWCARNTGSSTVQYLLASGLLGGYSTFSTASVEGAKLILGGKPGWAFIHTAGMMAVSLGLLLLGMLV